MANEEYLDAYHDACANALSELSDGEIERIAARKVRLDATARGEDPSAPQASPVYPLSTAIDALAHYHGKDGRHAVARDLTKAIRADDTPAYEYADRPDQRGGLVKLRPKCASVQRASKQATIRASHNAAASNADTVSRYRKIDALLAPGGSWWRACPNRAAKRDAAKRRHEAAKLAERAEYRAAIALLRNGFAE